MNETYASLASFAQTGGLLLLLVGFMFVLVYALTPSRKKVFDTAAQMPLQED